MKGEREEEGGWDRTRTWGGKVRKGSFVKL